MSTTRGQRESPGLKLDLLKGFRLRSDGTAIQLLISVQRLVAFVALQDRPLPRGFVARTLWPDSPDARAAANLRSTLWRLNNCAPRLVIAKRQELELQHEVEVDVDELSRLATELQDPEWEVSAADLGRVSRLGDLLPGWYDDWILMERERVLQLRLRVLEAICDGFVKCGRYSMAVEAGLAAVSAEPLRESANHALIRAYLGEGNWTEAVRRYKVYQRMLHTELGVEPSSALTNLVSRFQR